MKKEVLLFSLLGISSSLPWNVLISATKFFNDRFYHTSFEMRYESLFGIMFSFSSLAVQSLFVLKPKLLSDKSLIIAGYRAILICFVFLMLISLTGVRGPGLFPQISMATILVTAVFTSFIVIGLSRISSKNIDSSTAITSSVVGQAGSALFVTFINVLIQSFSPLGNAMILFSCVVFFVLLSLFCFFLFQHSYLNYIEDEEDIEITLLEKTSTRRSEVLYEARILLATLVLVNLCTTTVYPSLTNLLPKEMVATQFFLFTLSDFCGRATTFRYSLESEKYVFLLSLLRAILIQNFCGLVFEDYNSVSEKWFRASFLHIIWGFSSGFLASNTYLLTAAKFNVKEEMDIAASAVVLCIGAGMTFGSGLSFTLL